MWTKRSKKGTKVIAFSDGSFAPLAVHTEGITARGHYIVPRPHRIFADKDGRLTRLANLVLMFSELVIYAVCPPEFA